MGMRLRGTCSYLSQVKRCLGVEARLNHHGPGTELHFHHLPYAAAYTRLTPQSRHTIYPIAFSFGPRL